MDYMLETRGLTKRFGRGDQAQDAVADVSLHIRDVCGKQKVNKMACSV